MHLSWWLLMDALVAGLAALIFGIFACFAVMAVVTGYAWGYDEVLRMRAKYPGAEPGGHSGQRLRPGK